MNNLSEKYLPQSARDIVSVIGFRAFKKLVEEYGGAYIYVPIKNERDSQLTQVIGMAAANKLSNYCPLETLEIPKCEAGLRALRDHDIRQRRANNESERSVALDVGLTCRQVRSINSGVTIDDGQQDMFE